MLQENVRNWGHGTSMIEGWIHAAGDWVHGTGEIEGWRHTAGDCWRLGTWHRRGRRLETYCKRLLETGNMVQAR